MRIDLNANLVGAAENAGQSQKSSSRSASASNRDARAGGIEQLSADKVRLHSLENRINSMPEARQEKVEALGKAVRNGTYEPPAEKTAEAVMTSMTAGRALR